MKAYKDTLLLGHTTFPMKARLSEREPQWLAQWQETRLYERLRAVCAGRPVFFLHDGPPYANGDIHIGHAVNKILKDMIVREKTLSGFDAPYIPGWDCHGMPIEIQVEKQQGRQHTVLPVLSACRTYAQTQIERQKASFQRLGVLADWAHPYQTMSYHLESEEVACLSTLLKTQCVQRGLKPVNWCLCCESALAEAEVEYHTKTSTAIDVSFRVVSGRPAVWADYESLSVIIWTTTPWTIPCNQAVCVHPHLPYALIDVAGRAYIVAEACVPTLLTRYPQSALIPAPTCLGAELSTMCCQHPLIDKVVPCLLGEHVTTEQGTGLVHTAPAHGMDDYQVAVPHGLDVTSYVDAAGYYDQGLGWGAGKQIREVEPALLAALRERDALLHEETIQHAYPHCWRHKTPIIFRSTYQWFLRLDQQIAGGTEAIRTLALSALSSVTCFPEWGKERLQKMIQHRPDWCLSRQRKWGVPITVFIHRETGALHPDTFDFFPRIIEGIRQEGIEYWARIVDDDFLSEADQQHYEKVTDTLDVWFDSGITHHTVAAPVAPQIDLCVEGSDQHRGWFHSSLLTSVALKGTAPYRALLTHGFVVDGQGLKMSKSQGNVISPQLVIDRFGADVLRLWVASTDFAGEMSISEEILTHTVDVYRRIRNTIRFLLANLSDFYAADCLPLDRCLSIDRYAIDQTHALLQEVRALYAEYRFHVVVQKIQHFASEFLGAFYLDILKDRLYTASAKSAPRRAAQTALFHIMHVLVQMIAPILPLTAEEAWSAYYHDQEDSLFFHGWHEMPATAVATDEQAVWAEVMRLRAVITKALESHRREGLLGSSLQAAIVIHLPDPLYARLQPHAQELRFVFMVSQCEIVASSGPDEPIVVSVLNAPKCPRCWHYTPTVGQDERDQHLCTRCADNLYGEGEVRVFA